MSRIDSPRAYIATASRSSSSLLPPNEARTSERQPSRPRTCGTAVLDGAFGTVESTDAIAVSLATAVRFSTVVIAAPELVADFGFECFFNHQSHCFA
jgi:hypothetical protein